MIGPDLRPRLHAYLGGIVRNLDGVALSINGVEDHVHMLVRLHQGHAIMNVLRDIKSRSSGWVHETYPDMPDFAWQRGYGAFTVSGSHVPRLKKYIAGQETHHRKQDFKSEFTALLEKHGVEYDLRYIWD
jgi:REP element-mobilizing transposase RayT